jgi:hypothetical protein
VSLLLDTGTAPALIPSGLAPSPVILLQNPTPLGGGPSVTVYLDYNPNVTVSNAAYSVAPGASLSLIVSDRPLYAVSSQYGLLFTDATIT